MKKADLQENLTKIAARGLHEVRTIARLAPTERYIPPSDTQIKAAFVSDHMFKHAVETMVALIVASVEAVDPHCSYCGRSDPEASVRTLCGRCRM